MEVLEYFTTERKEHWLSEIKKSDWGAGQFLASLIEQEQLKDAAGETTLVPMLVEGDKLVAFCTLAPYDDIQPTELTPWIGFVYTFPEYRGHRYAGRLLDYAESIATIMGREYVYISTNHVGLYEKYGYEFFRMDKDMEGEDSRVYRKALAVEGPEKDRRIKAGGAYKGAIVEKARKGTDPIAYCGFSCNHCFLGEWCGGCKSVFSCCSFGTLFEGGKCPNMVCCKERGIDGCYECEELAGCKNGFYKDGNDGAVACKAQAMFLKKHGKKAFLQVQDALHKSYDFKKVQEILGENLEDAIKILESCI